MFNKWQRCLNTVIIVVILAALVENRSYNNGLIFYDAQAHSVFLPPTVSVSRGRGLASVKYSSKGSIWSTFGKPCDCSGAVCGCCAGISVKQYDFDQKMCANVTFLAKKQEAILDVYLNKAPSSRYGISARNPSPLCIPVMLPIPMAMCVQMSDIAIKGNNLHMCMDFVVRLATTDFFEMHFQCMQMGLDGVQYLDKNGKPVLPMGTKSQTMNNGEHSKEENQYDDEDLPNENEIDSNENKVEQNDYEEEEEEEEEDQEPNEEATNDEVDTLNTVTAETIDKKGENDDKAAEEADEVDDKVAENGDHAQSAINMDTMIESATNLKNLTINETAHEKLDGNTTFAAMHEHDMNEMETVVNAATMSPMATTTMISTTTSTTTATNTAGNNVEYVDGADKMTVAVTEKPNDADANDDKENDNNENEGEEQSEDEDDGDGDDEDDEDDDDESEDEDSDEDDEDDDENEDENDEEHHVNDDANKNNEEYNNAKDDATTKIFTEISNSNAQIQPGAERTSLKSATFSNQAASISPLFLIASETAPGTEKTSSKRHLKLLNYRRARG